MHAHLTGPGSRWVNIYLKPMRIEYKFLRNNKNKGSRSNVNKHELVYGESSSNARDAPDVCLSFVLLFTIFVIVVMQKQVLQQSKNVTANCTETLLPPPCIQFSLFKTVYSNECRNIFRKDNMAVCLEGWIDGRRRVWMSGQQHSGRRIQ